MAHVHRVDEGMQIEDSVDDMMEELSPSVRSDNFEIFDGETHGLESVRKDLDKGSPDTRSIAAQQETEVGVSPAHIQVNNDDRCVMVQQEYVEGVSPCSWSKNHSG
jgi:hypothetical protein